MITSDADFLPLKQANSDIVHMSNCAEAFERAFLLKYGREMEEDQYEQLIERLDLEREKGRSLLPKIDREALTFVYVVSSDSHNAGKVGISGYNNWPYRMADHHQNGWVHHRSMCFRGRGEAHDAEQATLAHLRQMGIPPVPTLRRKMPQNGWTETFHLRDASVPFVCQIIERMHDHERAPCRVLPPPVASPAAVKYAAKALAKRKEQP